MNNIIPSLKAIIDPSLPLMANLSNASAVLNMMEDINWCGFYLKDGENLYLGPFQGDVACTTININRGVCGYAARNKTAIIVPDVNKFDGHIACSSLSKSEIVVPIIVDNEVKAVIDIDAPIFDRFHDEELDILNQAADILKELF